MKERGSGGLFIKFVQLYKQLHATLQVYYVTCNEQLSRQNYRLH